MSTSGLLNFGTISEQEKNELPFFLKTECGQSLKTAIDCVKASHNQVKGIDCHVLIREYLDCCGANPSACAQRFADSDTNPFATGEEDQ